MIQKRFVRLASRFLAATAICAGSFSAQAAGLYIFGDSLSDTGNNYTAIASQFGAANAVTPNSAITSNSYIPSAPFSSNNYTNGQVWSDYLATMLGYPAATRGSLQGGTNFAFGGAVTGGDPTTFPYSLRSQVGQYLGATGGVADASGIYVIEGGGNNARAVLSGGNPKAIAAAAAAYAADIKVMVDQLRGAGATNIIVWNTPRLEAAPAVLSSTVPGAVQLAAATTGQFNASLVSTLSTYNSGVRMFDVWGAITRIPASSGITDFTNACISGTCNAGATAFWDGIHPSTAAHQQLAIQMAALVPAPGVAFLVLIGLAGLGFSRRRT